MRALWNFFDEHFEALVFGNFWATASLLAALAGRPLYAAVGLVTVLPFLLLYAGAGRRPKGPGPP
ncbi:MAG: hypothetical protein ACYC8T_23215 [Myxococcaceae bacterium]